MAKKWYEVTLKPLQPLHIGSGNYGVVNPTWIYLPGWTIWGALTASFGIKNGWDKKNLSNEQKELFEEVSNFYPVIDGKILFPKYKKGEFCLGEFSEKQFRFFATDTFTSTAINASYQSANESSLHEIEYLLPKTKEDKPKDIYWKGIINIEDDLRDFLSSGSVISIGGERSKGFGRVIIYKVNQLEEKEKWNIEEDIVSFDTSKPSVHFLSTGATKQVSKGELISHTEISESDRNTLEFDEMKWIIKPGCVCTSQNLILNRGIVRPCT
ncbi:MAG: hypothetical protein PHR06_04070 [Candidatus Cloacimonetes bacterium]|nr:hypothetical protein [Candidatus Cloacimonadota bacterium]